MMARISRLKTAMMTIGLVALAACTGSNDLAEPPVPMGDFLLGYAIVVADEAKMMPPSRSATPDEWKTLLSDQIKQRFSRYDGSRYYHIAVSVDAYALAIPGIPIVVSPKSALAISVTVWDDEAGAKLNEEPRQFTVLENLSGKTVIGSGLTQSREAQMENLSKNAAKLIEKWMVENGAAWFGETGGDSAEVPAAQPIGAEAEITETVLQEPLAAPISE